MFRLAASMATGRHRAIAGALLIVSGCGRSERPSVSPTSASRISTGRTDPLVLRGHALLAATHDSLPQYARATMRCFSCHLDDGQRAGAMPLGGAYARLPAYHARTGRIISIEDRVNSCFTRSLAGAPLPAQSREMQAIVAYLRTLSTAPRDTLAARDAETRVAFSGDPTRGHADYDRRCARCHGMNGEGAAAVPPLWGPHSFGIGASFARLSRVAHFIRRNMPYDSAGTLDSATAVDVAAYIVSKPRPDTPGKAGDWPHGDAPWDVPYATVGHQAFRAPTALVASEHVTARSSITRSPEK